MYIPKETCSQKTKPVRPAEINVFRIINNKDRDRFLIATIKNYIRIANWSVIMYDHDVCVRLLNYGCVCVIALTIVYACVCLCHCPILNSFAMYTNHTWRSYHFRIVYEQCMCVWKLAYVLAYISVYVVVVLFAERQNTLANWSHMEQHELIAQVWSDSFIFGNVFKGRLLLLIIRACRVRL